MRQPPGFLPDYKPLNDFQSKRDFLKNIVCVLPTTTTTAAITNHPTMFLNTSSTNGFYAKKHFGYPIDFVSIPDEMRALSMALNITCNVT